MRSIAVVALLLVGGFTVYFGLREPAPKPRADVDQIHASAPSSQETLRSNPGDTSITTTTPEKALEQQMVHSTDLLGFVEDLEHAAMNDARSARYLAKVMQECAFLQNPKVLDQHRRNWAYLRPHMQPGSEKIRVALGEQLIGKCQSLASARPNLSEQAKRWSQRADELGDIEARLKPLRDLKLPVNRQDTAQMEAFGEAAEQFLEMASSNAMDSNDAIGLARFLTSEQGRALFNPSSPIGQLANQSSRGVTDVIACALGADCSRNGPILTSGCLNSGLCSYATVEDALRAQAMGSEELLRLQQLARDVASMLRAGDMQRLTSPKG